MTKDRSWLTSSFVTITLSNRPQLTSPPQSTIATLTPTEKSAFPFSSPKIGNQQLKSLQVS